MNNVLIINKTRFGTCEFVINKSNIFRDVINELYKKNLVFVPKSNKIIIHVNDLFSCVQTLGDYYDTVEVTVIYE